MSKDAKKNAGILLETGTNEVEFLEFTLGSGRFGVNVAKVTQALVFDESALAALPATQDGSELGVAGTTMFRDEPILVVDLAALILTEAEKAKRPDSKRLLLVLEFNKRTTGYIVDGVSAIRRVSWLDFKETDESNIGPQAKFVSGIVYLNNQMVIILDFESILGTLVPGSHPESYTESLANIGSMSDKELKVLYCEDSGIVQKVAMKAFKAAGIKNVRVFPTGKDGLEFLQTPEGQEVNLIVSDIEMPVMDGLTLCKNVKSDARFKSVPFLFFSSTINEQMKTKCERVGASASFSKPEIDKLIEALRNYI